MSELSKAVGAATDQETATVVHVDESSSSGGAAENRDDAGLRRRRRHRSVSSDTSDAYIEDLLRPWRSQRTAADAAGSGADAEAASSSSAASDSQHYQDQQGPGEPPLTGDAQAQSSDQFHFEADGAAEAQAPVAGGGDEERMCRICFDGPDQELGKLFSPCLCRGTSRYVHTGCLESWRKASPNARAFWECQQCGYQYRLHRTTLARLVTSPLPESIAVTVTLLTISFFLLLVYLAGFFANSLLAVVEHRRAASSGLFDDWFVSDHILVGEGIREAVAFVSHQLEESPLAAGRHFSMDRVLEGEDDGSTAYRFIKPFVERGGRAEVQNAAPPFWARAILHLTKGSALVGIVSVFYSFVATTFVTPIGRTLFRALRPAGGRRRGPTNGASISQLVIVSLIVVGIIKSIRQVYRGVKWLTKVVLSRVEDLVIEVAPA